MVPSCSGLPSSLNSSACTAVKVFWEQATAQPLDGSGLALKLSVIHILAVLFAFSMTWSVFIYLPTKGLLEMVFLMS